MKKKGFILGLVMGVFLVLPHITNAAFIDVNAESEITASTYISYYYGHYNRDSAFITVPGSGDLNSSHTYNVKSEATYDANTSVDNLFEFAVTMDHSLPYGGISSTAAILQFEVSKTTDYNISGNYTSDANYNTGFSVRLEDLSDNTYLFDQNTMGTLNGGDLTGTLEPGEYKFSIGASSYTIGSNTWSGHSVGYGPTLGGTRTGSGSVNLDLNAVPIPSTFLLLGTAILGLVRIRKNT